MSSNDSGRFKLIKVIKGNTTAEAIYLDRYEQTLVSEKIKARDKSTLDALRFSKGGRNLPARRTRTGLDVEYKTYGLGRTNTFRKTEISREARQHLKGQNFKLVKAVKIGREMRAVYYNKKKGEYIFRSIKNNSAGKAFSFPPKISHALQLDWIAKRDRFDRGVEKKYTVRTPWQLSKASKKLRNHMKPLFSNNHVLSASVFTPHANDLKAKMRGITRIREHFDPIRQSWVEAWYNSNTNELIYRRVKKDNAGKKIVQEDIVYSLNNPVDFENAFDVFWRHRMFSRNDILSFQRNTSSAQPCGFSSQVGSSGDLVPGLSDVLDVMHRDHLSEALPEMPIKMDRGNIILSTKVFGKIQPVVISMDKNGDIKDLNFGNVAKARRDNLFIEPRSKGLDGRSYYVLGHRSADGKDKFPLMEFSTYQVDLGSGNKTTRLSVRVKGKKKGNMDYSGSEEHIYDLKFNSDYDEIVEVGARNRVEANRVDPFNFKIEKNEKKSLSGLALGFLQILPADAGKGKIHREVTKAVQSEANKIFLEEDSSYKGALTTEQVSRLSREVANKVKLRTSNYKGNYNTIEAIAAEESYKLFTPIILKRSIKGMLPDESNKNIQNISNRLMEDFKKCLNRATQQQSREGSNLCMEAFAKEAPVKAGEEVLKLKMAELDMSQYTNIAAHHYKACIKEHYDPIYASEEACERKGTDVRDKRYKQCLERKIRKESLGLERVKSCLFSGFLKTTPKIVLSSVDTEVKSLEKTMGLKINLHPSVKKRSVKIIAKCLERRKLAKMNSFGEFEVDINGLDSVDSEKFEKGVTLCKAPVTAYVGRELAAIGIKDEMKGIKGLTEEQINSITGKVLNHGYDQCINRMQQLTSEPDPAECIRILKNFGVMYGAESLIGNMIGKDKYDELVQKTSNPLVCFQEENNRLFGNLKREIKNTPRNKTKKAQVIKAREKKGDEKTADCLKKMMVWVSGTAANDIMEDKIKSDPKLSVIEITPELTATVDKVIKECFEEHLQDFKTVADVLKAKDSAVEVCGTQMLKDEAVQKQVFDPVIALSLDKVDLGLTQEKKKKLKEELRKKLAFEIKDSESQEEILLKANEFGEKAVKDVVTFIMKDNLIDALRGDEKEVDRVAKIIEEKLFSDEKNYEQEFIKAMNGDPDTDLKKTINDFSYDAIDIVAQEKIDGTIKDAIGDGWFNNEEEAESSVNFLRKSFKTCMEYNKSQGQPAIAASERCESNVNITGRVFIGANYAYRYVKSFF